MKVAIRLARGDEADGVLMKLAGVSAVAHVVGVIGFSILPRFMEPPAMPRATIAEIVPASALSMPPGEPQAGPQQATPTERAEAARRARKPQEPPAPPKPKQKAPKPDPAVPPLETREKKPAKPPEPEPPASTRESEPEPEPEPQTPAEDPADRAAGPGGISFGGSSSPGGVPSIGSSAFPYDYYRSSLVSVLQSNWRRPVAPDGLDRTLTARVQFTILKSGIIQDPRVVERSGNDLLDQSALRAVYDSNPLPPLPFQYGFASVTAEVVFELTPD